MFARTKVILIIVCVLLFTFTLLGQRPGRPGQGPVVMGEPAAALVEAFIVEVNLPALAALDVSPIGEEPHAATVADILKCLGTGEARVIAGAKAASQQGNTESRATRTTYIGRQTGTPPQREYQPYDSGTTFTVSTSAAPGSGTAILVGFHLESSQFTDKAVGPDVPPDRAMWNWVGAVVLQPGRPEIVAASQEAERAFFLILTAHTPGQ